MAIQETLLSLNNEVFVSAALTYLGHRLVDQPELPESERRFVASVYRRLADTAPETTTRDLYLRNAERFEQIT